MSASPHDSGASNALRATIPLDRLRALCDKACHELTVRVSMHDGALADSLRDPHMRADIIGLILWRLVGHDPPHAARPSDA